MYLLKEISLQLIEMSGQWYIKNPREIFYKKNLYILFINLLGSQEVLE